MRRLTSHRRDRGAVAVLVAVAMVALLGFTALGVDMGAVWSDQKQLQNGADAGAIGIAQACADGNCTTYATNSNATLYAQNNKVDTNASGVITNLDVAGGTVTVKASSTRSLWFARAVGITTANVAASATAKWGPKSGGAFLPLAFSLCDFWAQSGTILGNPINTGTSMTLFLKSKTDITTSISGDPSACLTNTNAAHNEVSGGFGWLVPSGGSGTCTLAVSVGDWVQSSPGASAPCSIGTMLQNQIVQIPVFDQCKLSTSGDCVGGNGAQYHVYAIASFLVTGYCFPPDSWNVGACNSGTGPNGARIVGVFKTFTSADSSIGPGGPNLGANQVTLTK